MTRGEGISQHRVDQLIRELIRRGRAATADEIEQIIERMATAPFDERVVPVPTRLRGLSYHGRMLSRLPQLFCTSYLYALHIDEHGGVAPSHFRSE